jgi:hypothetical protein
MESWRTTRKTYRRTTRVSTVTMTENPKRWPRRVTMKRWTNRLSEPMVYAAAASETE